MEKGKFKTQLGEAEDNDNLAPLLEVVVARCLVPSGVKVTGPFPSIRLWGKHSAVARCLKRLFEARRKRSRFRKWFKPAKEV